MSNRICTCGHAAREHEHTETYTGCEARVKHSQGWAHCTCDAFAFSLSLTRRALAVEHAEELRDALIELVKYGMVIYRKDTELEQACQRAERVISECEVQP